MVGRQADLVVLSEADGNFLETQVRRHKAPAHCRSVADDLAVRVGSAKQGGCRTTRGSRAHGWQVAPPVRTGWH